LRASRYASLPLALQADLRQALATRSDKRSEVQKYLAEKLGPLVDVKASDAEKAIVPQEAAIIRSIAAQTASLAPGKRSHGSIQAVWEDGAAPSATRILRRGDWAVPLGKVAPGFPTALCQGGDGHLAPLLGTKGASSGRRLALARWLTASDQPLVGRVLV